MCAYVLDWNTENICKEENVNEEENFYESKSVVSMNREPLKSLYFFLFLLKKLKRLFAFN